MAQLSANGESDRTDSPLSVEGKRLASPFPFSITQPTLAIEESFRSLRLTPDLMSALIQALINISIAPTADTTASPEVFTFPGLFHLESMWNPWNPLGIPYGIHGMNVG